MILDLNGLLAGTHSVTPKVVLPDGIRLDGVLPETVEVVVRDGELDATPGLPRLPAAEAASDCRGHDLRPSFRRCGNAGDASDSADRYGHPLEGSKEHHHS